MGKQYVTTRKQRHTMDTNSYTKFRRTKIKQRESTTDVENKINQGVNVKLNNIKLAPKTGNVTSN